MCPHSGATSSSAESGLVWRLQSWGAESQSWGAESQSWGRSPRAGGRSPRAGGGVPELGGGVPELEGNCQDVPCLCYNSDSPTGFPSVSCSTCEKRRMVVPGCEACLKALTVIDLSLKNLDTQGARREDLAFVVYSLFVLRFLAHVEGCCAAIW